MTFDCTTKGIQPVDWKNRYDYLTIVTLIRLLTWLTVRIGMNDDDKTLSSIFTGGEGFAAAADARLAVSKHFFDQFHSVFKVVWVAYLFEDITYQTLTLTLT